MNYVIIFAGGVGTRMKSEMPKQFLNVDDKPILVHTIEKFENHPDIDGIVVVVNKDWINFSKDLKQKFNLNKVRCIIPGGKTGQNSIYNGLDYLVTCTNYVEDKDIVLVNSKFLCHSRLCDQMTVFSMHRNRIFRSHQRVDQLNLLLTRMTGYMYILENNLCTFHGQFIDNIGNCLLISRDWVGT